MTPSINAVKQANVPFKVYEYQHHTSCHSYGQEASDKLGLPLEQVFKTLVVELDTHELVVAIIPVSHQLNMKVLAKIAHAKKAKMAERSDVERSTGYVLGGVSPLGQKKRLRTFIDSSVDDFTTIFISAGRRGLEIELSPDDLIALAGADKAHIGQ
jgi:Cys-tRNA(Pro)/Cys-tRNA(Cys) deacylase